MSLLDRGHLTRIKKFRKGGKFLGEYLVDKIPFLEGISLEAFIGDGKRVGPYDNLSIITPFLRSGIREGVILTLKGRQALKKKGKSRKQKIAEQGEPSPFPRNQANPDN